MTDLDSVRARLQALDAYLAELDHYAGYSVEQANAHRR